MIPFNKPYSTDKEILYIRQALLNGKISGNGAYTKKCHEFLETRFEFKKCLLTTSGTDALEMAAILADIQPNDEVILPSYTFVSTANAFLLRGAKLIFADSQGDHPNIDPNHLKRLITPRTKVIVPVHYAGVACDMDPIMNMASKNGILVIEDAAQAIDSYYKERPLGSIGHLAAMSFHETKNISSGEGGMLIINDRKFFERSEIIWEKGTNRAAFFRGEVDKYNWVDVGSSFLPSELNAAFLYAQLENLKGIQNKRIALWEKYYDLLLPLCNEGFIQLPKIHDYASNNAHMMYILLKSSKIRSDLIKHLKSHEIHSVFHYMPLHNSDFFKDQYQGENLRNSIRFSDTILRLPMYADLELNQVKYISKTIHEFFK